MKEQTEDYCERCNGMCVEWVLWDKGVWVRCDELDLHYESLNKER